MPTTSLRPCSTMSLFRADARALLSLAVARLVHAYGSFIGCRQSGQAFLPAADRLAVSDGCRQSGQAFLSPAGERPTFLLAEKRGPKMRPSPVAHSAAPNGCASTGRVVLKAHPCACNTIRAIHRASRKRLFRPALADRKGWVDQKTKHPPQSGGFTQLRCVPSNFIPFRIGEMAQESPQGGRMDSASSLQVQGCTFSEPRSQLAQSCSFIARPTRPGALSLGYVSLGKQRKVTRSTQSSESLCFRGRREKRLTSPATAKPTCAAALCEMAQR